MINDFTLFCAAIALGLTIACFLLDPNDKNQL